MSTYHHQNTKDFAKDIKSILKGGQASSNEQSLCASSTNDLRESTKGKFNSYTSYHVIMNHDVYI